MKALSYLGSKHMHKYTHAWRSGHFRLSTSGSKTRQSKVSVNSVCVGKSEIQQCSLVGGLGLLIDSDILHHHVSSVVKENALDHLLSLTSVFKVWMKTVPKGSLASGIFPTQPRALEWPSTLPQALEWPSSGTERICLLQLFAENLTRSFSNRQLQNRPLLCLFLCLHFLLFIIWQRDCCWMMPKAWLFHRCFGTPQNRQSHSPNRSFSNIVHKAKTWTGERTRKEDFGN